ncbi:MAG: class I SAM-dependent methyltransferase [Methanobrevibacter sp.]|nr:class I SAM-dependent methyltransferase [Methanobrevibacter sp.]
MIKLEEKISDPKKLDWEYFWRKEHRKRDEKEKDWDKIAIKFGKWIENDDYAEKLINKLIIEKSDTILDLGCGEGTISIPLAKKSSKLTAIDLSERMLEQIIEKANKEGLNNINTKKMDLRDINLNNVGPHDVVIASRSVNSIFSIKDFLKNLNEIANKYVYLTIFGAENKKYEKVVAELLNKDYKTYPHYSYIFNLLVNIGISPNAENLYCESSIEYENMEDALKRIAWRLGGLNFEENKILKKHLEEILVLNQRGKLENPFEKAEWVLIWWKKEGN